MVVMLDQMCGFFPDPPENVLSIVLTVMSSWALMWSKCADLVETNDGIVNFIMKEYACYGKGHTIHSSGQIEGFKNSVDDRSVQVGGKQRICTIDGNAMPLTCRSGLRYLSIIGIPIWKGTQLYTLQGPMNGITQSWIIPTHLVMGSLLGPLTLMRDLPLILSFMNLGIAPKRQYKTLSILDDSLSNLTPCSTLMANQHVFSTNQHDVSPETPDYEKNRPYFGSVNVDTVQKTMEQSTQCGVSIPNTIPMKKHLKIGTLHLTFLEGMNLLPLILSSRTPLQ